jgi:hypothetical protein
VIVYCTSDRFGGEGSEGGKPVFHGNNTSNRSCVISAEEKMRIQHKQEEVAETDPKRMPPKAAKEAMMIDHARLAVEIPSPVPPAPPAIVISSYRVKMEDVR